MRFYICSRRCYSNGRKKKTLGQNDKAGKCRNIRVNSGNMPLPKMANRKKCAIDNNIGCRNMKQNNSPVTPVLTWGPLNLSANDRESCVKCGMTKLIIQEVLYD